ncbi:MAG TPA: hypothetical protein VF215_11105 [Thermoanaerobaculia bacterium]
MKNDDEKPEGRDSTRDGGGATDTETRTTQRKREHSSGSTIISPRELLTALRERFGPDVRTEFKTGTNGGVILTLNVPRTDEQVTEEFFPPDEERDDFEAVPPLLSFRLVCAILVIAPKTLYARARYMASATKRGGRWFFKKRLLYDVDLAEEAELPTRREIIAAREERRNAGETITAGRHALQCLREHERGPCSASQRRRPSRSERARNRRRLLDDLGK